MRYIVGIDEVGRGSLAGPVVVCAVALPRGLRIEDRGLSGGLRDSKKLTAKQRERWNTYFKTHSQIRYALARVYPRGIERMNISAAANLAALRALVQLITNNQLLITRCKVYLDGGLYLGNSRTTARGTTRKEYLRQSASRLRWSAVTVVRGDEKYTAIKVASIIAKVHRDRYMVRLAKRHPEYGFAVHKGYGTKMHRAAVRKHGPSEAHRLTFLLGFLQNFKPKVKNFD